jgi:hypothetical protein
MLAKGYRTSYQGARYVLVELLPNAYSWSMTNLLAHLIIGKMPNDIYKIEFDAVHGKLVGRVSVRISGTDTRSDEDKKQAALGKIKALARALDEAVVEV